MGGQESRDVHAFEHVRRRPHMYVGNVTNPDRLVHELLENAIDEATLGHVSGIHVSFNPDGSATVEDDGRGFSITSDADLSARLEREISVLESVVSQPWRSKDGHARCGRLRIGLCVVNFLSEWFEVVVCFEGAKYRLRAEHGQIVEPLTKTEGTKTEGTGRTGAKFTIAPDPKIFDSVRFSHDSLSGRCRELAFLNPGLVVHFSDSREPARFVSQDGIVQFVETLNCGCVPLHSDIIFHRSERGDLKYAIALQYNEGWREEVRSFVNCTETDEGGSHVTGFLTAIERVLSEFGDSRNLFDKVRPSVNDFRVGLTAVVTVELPNPRFAGPYHHSNLHNEEMGLLIAADFSRYLTSYFLSNELTGDAIVKHAAQSAQYGRGKSLQ